MLIKGDDEKCWIVCTKCNVAWDIRRGGGCTCKCGNIVTEKDKLGIIHVYADDSDAVVYDNSR